MKRSRILVASAASIALLGTSACVTDPNTGEQKVSRTGIGAALGGTLGYLLGGAIGGAAALCLAWTMGEELENWPLKQIRWALAVLALAAGIYMALLARDLI